MMDIEVSRATNCASRAFTDFFFAQLHFLGLTPHRPSAQLTTAK